MSCPFYAKGIALDQILDLPGSNRCALITDAHSPCVFVIDPLPTEPDWDACVRNPALNHTDYASVMSRRHAFFNSIIDNAKKKKET